MQDLSSYQPQYSRVFSRNPQLSNIKPSDWAEKHVVLPGGKGKVNYDYNPYCKRIIDCMAPDHPMRKGAVMKGAQITFSSGVIYPFLGYTIKENPCNTLLMVGHADLITPALEKLDSMIHGAKLGDYLSYQLGRKKNNKSGNTDEIKHFMNGYIKLDALTNPKAIAQLDLNNILLDDFDAMTGKSKIAGSFEDLVEMRAASNMNTYKLLMISTPLLKLTSNIEPAFQMGNQERYFVHCPCCHEPIIFKWKVSEGDIINPLRDDIATGNGGIYYERNNHDQLIEKSVGYICYKCAGFFTDKNKQQMLREADWMATAIPVDETYYSWHIPSLYAPVGQYNWAYYAKKHVAANREGQPADESKMQVLVNTCFGETYDVPSVDLDGKKLQRNVRDYEIGTIPEKISINDGNGRIILLTCAADMNGIMKEGNHDVRLDYEITAWAENGVYSIAHGSIGTFVPREGQHKTSDRVKWTYEQNAVNSVWPEFEKILSTEFKTDTGRTMKIGMTALDTSYFTTHAYAFVDSTNFDVVAIKGEKEDKYQLETLDAKIYREGKERTNLYILQVGLIKDRLAKHMQAFWDGETSQPANFMNFPQPGGGLYGWSNFFEHYEAEHRTVVTNADGTAMFRWVKKSSASQAHLWDCRVYNMAVREIVVGLIGKEIGQKNFTWKDYVAMLTGNG